MEEKTAKVVQNACTLLQKNGFDLGGREPSIEVLTGDGSQRCFYRLRFASGVRIIVIVPGSNSRMGKEEAFSSWYIGRHLRGKDVPVPEYIAFERETGLILSEDLGDIRLYEYVKERNVPDKNIWEIYQRIIRELVNMQINGAKEFRASWCFQTPVYDRQLMLERESGYFMEALCRQYLQMESFLPALEAEFADIADKAARAPAHFFLHRDFQSRNIMIKEGMVRFIDFQGGRFGPLGYDLASLLLDPYTGIPADMQEKLFGTYIQELRERLDYDEEQFRQEYVMLSLQRNLQILGAFAFLSHQRGKMFFRPFIRPALHSLKNILTLPELRQYQALGDLVRICIEKIELDFPAL